MKLRNFFFALTFFLSTQTTEPAKPKPDPRFGAVESYMAPQQAAELNVGWDRMIIYWDKRQPNNEQEWIVSDDEKQIMATAAASGREMVALLMSTPKWASSDLNGGGVPVGLYLSPDDPQNTWANFVRQLATEYKGRITHWIIWNEPDIAPGDYGAQFNGSVKDYYQLLKVAYLVSKEVDPHNVIHLAGLTYWHDIVYKREPYLKRLLTVMRADPTAPKHNYYFDVLTLHIYFRTDTVAEIIESYQYLLRLYGLTKPIWLNETNAPPNDDPLYPAQPFIKATQDQQAAFIVQANALALAAGAERIAVYKLIDLTGPLAGGEMYGLYRPDFSARPAVEAYRAVTTHFANTHRAARATQYDYQLVTLWRSNAVTRIAWARRDHDATIYLSRTPHSTQAALYTHLGQPLTLTISANNQFVLKLPTAICDKEVERCDLGGAPLILVETLPAPTAMPPLTPLPSPTPKP